MEIVDLAWLAGILEGEGSFLKAPPSDPGRPRISLQMTDEDVVARAAVLLGVKYSSSKDRKRPTWKPTFQLQVKGKRAAGLMRELYPQMGQRRLSLTWWKFDAPEKQAMLSLDVLASLVALLGKLGGECCGRFDILL